MQEVFVMHSLVLMMALGNPVSTTAVNATEHPNVVAYADHGHMLYQRGCGCRGCHRRHGCYCSGCYCSGCTCHCCGCCHCYGSYGSYGGYGSFTTVARAQDKATVVVTLPADAKLTIDDQPTKSTSGTRTFVSPS